MVSRFIYVLMAVALFIVVLLFSLDPLLGAVGLRAIYRPLGVTVGIMSLVLIPFAIRYERMTSNERLTYLIITAIIGIVAATPISVPLSIVGWFTGLITGAFFIPVVIVAVVFGVVLVVVTLSSLRETKSTAKVLTVLLLLYSAGYFIGIGAKPIYAESEMPDRLIYNNHQYFLYLGWGWLGDPDTLLLYECNTIGLYCEVIYKAPTGNYRDKAVSIAIDETAQTVSVHINGAGIAEQISPRELTETDVKYLCASFKTPTNDPFCSDPRFQDRTTFYFMVRRTLGRINYNSVRPLFKSARTLKGIDCPPPDVAFANSTENEITCQLRFPNDPPYYIRFTMSKYRDSLSYDLRLIIPSLKDE
jgi:hypothetical protein